MEKYKLKIVTLQEMRWNNSESMQLKNTTLLYSARHNRKAGESDFVVN